MGFTSTAVGYVERQCIVCYRSGVQNISISSEHLTSIANENVFCVWLSIWFTINSSSG